MGQKTWTVGSGFHPPSSSASTSYSSTNQRIQLQNLESSFKNTIKTVAIVNLNHQDPKAFLTEACFPIINFVSLSSIPNFPVAISSIRLSVNSTVNLLGSHTQNSSTLANTLLPNFLLTIFTLLIL